MSQEPEVFPFAATAKLKNNKQCQSVWVSGLSAKFKNHYSHLLNRNQGRGDNAGMCPQPNQTCYSLQISRIIGLVSPSVGHSSNMSPKSPFEVIFCVPPARDFFQQLPAATTTAANCTKKTYFSSKFEKHLSRAKSTGTDLLNFCQASEEWSFFFLFKIFTYIVYSYMT